MASPESKKKLSLQCTCVYVNYLTLFINVQNKHFQLIELNSKKRVLNLDRYFVVFKLELINTITKIKIQDQDQCPDVNSNDIKMTKKRKKFLHASNETH